MLCSMCVCYLNIFCLLFVSETKVLYDVLFYAQLKHRQRISVNVFRALLNSAVSSQQSVVTRDSQQSLVLVNLLSYQSKSKGNQSKSTYWYSFFGFYSQLKRFTKQLVVCCLFVVCCRRSPVQSEHKNVKERSLERLSFYIVLSLNR